MTAGKSNREMIREVFQGKKFPLPPVSMRLDLWHNHAESDGTLPVEIEGLTTEEVEDYLGFCRSARYRPHIELDFGDNTYTRNCELQGFREVYSLDGHELRRIVRETEEMRRAGMLGHITEYPLKDRQDCESVLEALRHARVRIDVGDFEEFERATGDKGNPLCILGPTPAHVLMLSWMGYENFYLLQNDFPDLIDSLIRELEGIYIRDLWPVARGIAAELILHGAHFSERLTPKPIFQKCFLPYLVRFNKAMHERGKKVLFHSDADLGNLAPFVLEAGFDGADCLATRPLVKETIEDYLSGWNGRIVCWGGLPGTLFASSCPMTQFRRYVDDLREATHDMSSVIIGASDNVMPGTPWKKLLYVRDSFGTHS